MVAVQWWLRAWQRFCGSEGAAGAGADDPALLRRFLERLDAAFKQSGSPGVLLELSAAEASASPQAGEPCALPLLRHFQAAAKAMAADGCFAAFASQAPAVPSAAALPAPAAAAPAPALPATGPPPPWHAAAPSASSARRAAAVPVQPPVELPLARPPVQPPVQPPVELPPQAFSQPSPALGLFATPSPELVSPLQQQPQQQPQPWAATPSLSMPLPPLPALPPALAQTLPSDSLFGTSAGAFTGGMASPAADSWAGGLAAPQLAPTMSPPLAAPPMPLAHGCAGGSCASGPAPQPWPTQAAPTLQTMPPPPGQAPPWSAPPVPLPQQGPAPMVVLPPLGQAFQPTDSPPTSSSLSPWAGPQLWGSPRGSSWLEDVRPLPTDSYDQLLAKVSQAQQGSEQRSLWSSLCDTEGGGVRAPYQQPERFLRRYLERCCQASAKDQLVAQVCRALQSEDARQRWEELCRHSNPSCSPSGADESLLRHFLTSSGQLPLQEQVAPQVPLMGQAFPTGPGPGQLPFSQPTHGDVLGRRLPPPPPPPPRIVQPLVAVPGM